MKKRKEQGSDVSVRAERGARKVWGTIRKMPRRTWTEAIEIIVEDACGLPDEHDSDLVLKLSGYLMATELYLLHDAEMAKLVKRGKLIHRIDLIRHLRKSEKLIKTCFSKMLSLLPHLPQEARAEAQALEDKAVAPIAEWLDEQLAHLEHAGSRTNETRRKLEEGLSRIERRLLESVQSDIAAMEPDAAKARRSLAGSRKGGRMSAEERKKEQGGAVEDYREIYMTRLTVWREKHPDSKHKGKTDAAQCVNAARYREGKKPFARRSIIEWFDKHPEEPL